MSSTGLKYNLSIFFHENQNETKGWVFPALQSQSKYYL